MTVKTTKRRRLAAGAVLAAAVGGVVVLGATPALAGTGPYNVGLYVNNTQVDAIQAGGQGYGPSTCHTLNNGGGDTFNIVNNGSGRSVSFFTGGGCSGTSYTTPAYTETYELGSGAAIHAVAFRFN